MNSPPSATGDSGGSLEQLAAAAELPGDAIIGETPRRAMAPDVRVDLLECVAAFGRSVHDRLDPVRLLTGFSARAQRPVPHDYIAIMYREDDGETCSVFAEYAVRRASLCDGGHYATAFQRGGRLPAEALALMPVFRGEVQIIEDLSADRHVADRPALRAKMAESALRARLAVPLLAAGRIVGALVVMSGTAGIYGEAQAAVCRQIADLVGPFVETVVALHRERRRRERLNAVTALPTILGASLTVSEVLERLGEAVRPLIDFDVMRLRLLAPAGQGFERIGPIVATPPAHPTTTAIEEYSIAERLRRGEMVLIRDAERELDPRRPGDRRIIESGGRSLLAVPLFFGERVGGCLVFRSSRLSWYDESDIEVAQAIAAPLVLALQHQQLAEEERRARGLEKSLRRARCELHRRYGFEQIIGRSPLLREALASAARVAPTQTTVLLTGESGTGKELVARAIHYASPRADGPLVAVNCAALPDALLESELFGHERGAFTGADRRKPGRFELAAGGTLFLDEVGDLSAPVQVKLLRVLQEREYQRVGGTATLKADVRLIAATNRDLAAEMAAGRFRSDLYYRLNVFNVHLPALRERGDDVLLLADQFIRDLSARMGKAEITLSREAAEALPRHRWPGNIRELQNAIERALIACEGRLITAAHLGLRPGIEDPAPPAPAATPPTGAAGSLQELERAAVLDALRRTQGQKSRAAALLGITRFQLYARLKRFGIDVPRE
jgi:transcriptional regulator with GAF, ATPase, and Fis domain